MSNVSAENLVDPEIARRKLAEVKQLLAEFKATSTDGRLSEENRLKTLASIERLEVVLEVLGNKPEIEQTDLDGLLKLQAMLQGTGVNSASSSSSSAPELMSAPPGGPMTSQTNSPKILRLFYMLATGIIVIGLAMILVLPPAFGIAAAINAGLAVALGISVAGPLLPFILLVAAGLLISLEIGLLAVAAGGLDGKMLGFQGSPEAVKPKALYLAIMLPVLVASFAISALALPGLPFLLGGFVGVGIAVGALWAIIGLLSLVRPGFLEQFFEDAALEKSTAAVGSAMEIEMARPTPLRASSLSDTLPKPIAEAQIAINNNPGTNAENLLASTANSIDFLHNLSFAAPNYKFLLSN